ncbi:molybdopterin-dependent oxidoreductase [Segniliparus rugosus]|uniref:Molybdopterin guanine dinucleotide-containing S/N-oxide reductase n=1 Tax=Segniliparus rugosus (strain ATCC BAA-974 / DSM 45345 / CCUG 50838 / CIP 108380 / JCM 13579 / CDC 945) TaxID=679197 RepID=E5XMC1_SEGRC|nr:molybdopterin-dependent oxidoreductase [Segniliparus rugosus]EFV14500.1 molybdopterin guanine dinucleotide-containing S/N-oxide reductase [Segniliparus rugosus ATCC BAA-974]
MRRQHLSHWGTFQVETANGDVARVHPYPLDPDPSPLLGNIPGSITHRSRVRGPAVRRGWLEHGPGPSDQRGADEFVRVTWAEATELLAAELRRVIDEHGNEAIYGGSYGWASAGRFHHAQSQVHRFLNCAGGYTASRNTYSTGAAEVVMPHVLGLDDEVYREATSWNVIAERTELLVAFGGVALKNSSVNPGGSSVHPARQSAQRLVDRGGRIVSVSPLRADLPDPRARWLSLVPGSDVAVMLALAHTLVEHELHDTAFLERYCVGWPQFERYLLGASDGLPKTARWAEPISGIPADEIVGLAKDMAAKRTLIAVSWSLQRTKHGEQAPWAGMVLAAMLGQVGLPGGGFVHGLGATNGVGIPKAPFAMPRFPQGRNPTRSFIPVAAVSELLLRPGETLDYNGERLLLPDIRLVWWAGGNPFHHQQNLPRLRRAFRRPDTVVVNDPYWTATAKHADIVLASTTSYERDDISGANNEPLLVAMQQAAEPFADARDDYQTFAELAGALGFREAFTEGRDARQWLVHMYETWRAERVRDTAGLRGLPDFEEFWARGHIELPLPEEQNFLSGFREDPESRPLSTPSGRIEIFSTTIDSFGYSDCAGHPAWYEPEEWLHGCRAEQFPLHLIANQPRTRLHSQLDHGATSQGSKVNGREPIRIHPADAAARGVATGDVVRVFNDRGSLLAGVVVDEGVRERVAQLSTGAWFDPADPADPDSMCGHGNPNVLTSDALSSSLAQGCTGQHVLVQIERFCGELPPIRAYDPPAFHTR